MQPLPFHAATPLWAVLVSLLAAPLIVLCGKRPNLREGVSMAAGLTKLWLVASMAGWVLADHTHTYELCRLLPGISLLFRVDAAGLLFALVAASLWLITTLYSVGYMRGLAEHRQTRFFACFSVALSATLGVAFSGNLFTLYVFYEMLSLATWPLVTHHQDDGARRGGRMYLGYLLATSIGLALPAMVITHLLCGSLDFSAAGLFPAATSRLTLAVLLLLFLFGFAKAGLMPLHGWLPAAMVAPTPVSALLHAVAVVKVGVFSLMRVLSGVFGFELLRGSGLNTLICGISGVTLVTASLFALFQDNLKRRLAFSTIGQLAYIVFGIGLATPMGIKGGLLHIAMHASAKITLFFCAGAIFVATGKRKVSELSGIGRRMPITMTAFSVATLSLIGLPPGGGALSKQLIVEGGLGAGLSWAEWLFTLSALLNAAYFLPIVYVAFFRADQGGKGIAEAPAACWLAAAVTALASVALFLEPGIFLALADQMALGVP
ncbi:MAG: monovalent cation/H+ antiporter subunit D family protein [Thermodesulfobacteriota bacterium]